MYIKESVPQVATIFTVHSTILGRTIASAGLPLYKELETYHGESMARRFNIMSQYSLEKTAALSAILLRSCYLERMSSFYRRKRM